MGTTPGYHRRVTRCTREPPKREHSHSLQRRQPPLRNSIRASPMAKRRQTPGLGSFGGALGVPLRTRAQFLNANVAEVEGLAFGLDADVAAVGVQLLELPGPLAI